MAYDRLAESIALIETRRVEPVRRLSRRRRFAAMAVDVSGDLAVTMFARRGVSCIWQEIHVLACRDGEWRWLGGGGSSSRGGDDDLLADRPMVLPSHVGLGGDSATARRVMAVSGSGGTRDGGDGTASWSRDGGWISYADVRVSAEVTSVKVADRLLPVQWHGHVLVVWSGDQPPRAVALDEGGNSRGEALFPRTDVHPPWS